MASEQKQAPRSRAKGADTTDEELDKILSKAFDDIRKRVNTLMAKREKKLTKAFKVVPKETKSRPKKEVKGKEAKDAKNYKRSQSSSSSDSSDE